MKNFQYMNIFFSKTGLCGKQSYLGDILNGVFQIFIFNIEKDFKDISRPAFSL